MLVSHWYLQFPVDITRWLLTYPVMCVHKMYIDFTNDVQIIIDTLGLSDIVLPDRPG